MTVRDWLANRQPPAPPALVQRMLELLGADADAPADSAGEVCLRCAARSLDRLLFEQRFNRDSAFELLAIDALTTYAFEHASGKAKTAADMEAIARQGAHLFSEIAARV